MSQSPFQKFVPKKKNSVVKEEFRQEKKKYRKDRNAFFEEKKKAEYEARQAKKGGMATKAADEAKVKKSLAATDDKPRGAAKTPHQKSAKAAAANDNAPTGIMPLNKFMAHCGVCSRRDAVEFVNAGKVKVNGEVVKEPGYKIQEKDEVIYNGKKLFVTKNLVYILLQTQRLYYNNR